MDNESAAPTARCGAYVGIDTAASIPQAENCLPYCFPMKDHLEKAGLGSEGKNALCCGRKTPLTRKFGFRKT